MKPEKETTKHKKTIRILAFGDVFGRPGREAVAKILPLWKKKFLPDLVLANGENVSHGKGISETTLAEIRNAGVDIVTGGNHILEGKNALDLLADPKIPLLRPINFIPSLPGRGFLYRAVGDTEILVINAIAQTHMRIHYDSPYTAIEKILKENEASKKAKVVIIDWHAETTSEKVALGWWLDGRVSLIYGTHTHTPTADERILPKGTGLISDIGMTGAKDGILGMEKEAVLHRFLTGLPAKFNPPKSGMGMLNAIKITCDPKEGAVKSIERIQRDYPLGNLPSH